MRILHVISSPATGGAEVYVKDLVIELKRIGHEVFVGFLNHAVDVGRSQEYEDLFLSELDAAAIPYFFIGYETRNKIWLGVWRVRKYVKNNSIDIYHAHLPYSVLFGSLLKIPCLYTHHTIDKRMSSFQYSVFNKIIDEYVGISGKCSERLKEYTGRSVTTIQNGVNFNKIKINRLSLINTEVVQAIAIGRLNVQKNYHFMIDAVSMLPEASLSFFSLKIAGEGTEKNKILEYIEKKGLGSIISLIGNRDDIPDLLAESDIFLMSSDFEGLPIALIEASVSGLPCLVTDVGGCSEIIDLCKNGFFVEKNDIENYVDKLNRLISSDILRKEFSHNALVNSSSLNIEYSAKEHLSLYEKLLGKIDL